VIKRVSFVSLVAICVVLQIIVIPAAAGPPPPDAAQAVVGPELLISAHPTMPDTNRSLPAVAYNYVRGEYLVVWHNVWGASRDIYARRVSQSGQLLSWFTVSNLPNSCFQPAVAYDAANANYLVVWMYDAHGDGSQYEIWGRIIDWDGPGTSVAFQIMAWPNRTFWSPRVAWNNNRSQFFVVWNAFDTGTGLPNDIAGKRVSAGGIPDASATILTTSTEPHQVDLAYNWSTDEWFIAFVRSYSIVPPATSNDIYGQRIAYGGGGSTLIPGGVIPINTELKHQNAPAVAVDGQGNVAVVFEHEYSATDHDIYLQMLDSAGNLSGGRVFISNWAEDELSPDIAASFSPSPAYLVIWQQETTTGYRIGGTHWGPGQPYTVFDLADYAFWEATSPAVNGGYPGFLIAYEGDAPGDPMVKRQIYGSTFAPFGIYLPLVVRG